MATRVYEIRFYPYCEQCVHYEKTEDEEPCCYCLDVAFQEMSETPIHFKKKEVQNGRGKTRSQADNKLEGS